MRPTNASDDICKHFTITDQAYSHRMSACPA